MTVATPKPRKKVNRIGLETKVYRGGKTTLCAGCGHNSISERIISACYEMGVEPILARLPGQVERVDRNAVAAEAGSRIVRGEAEGLRRCSVDNLENVDVHLVGDGFHLVHETDIYCTMDVLEQFSELGHLGR